MALFRKVTIGSVGTSLVLGAVVVGYRLAFRESVMSHVVTRPCGALVHRTTSMVRKRPFEERARIDSESTLEGPDGAVVASDVRVTACAFVPGRAAFTTGAPGVRVFDGASPARTVDVGFVPEALAWSKDGVRLAAIARGKVAIEEGDGRVAVLAVDASVAPVGFAFSNKGDFCFVESAPREAGKDGYAELWCERDGCGVQKLSRASWTGVDAPAWVAFGRAGPLLCGDELSPRNHDCFGLARP